MIDKAARTVTAEKKPHSFGLHRVSTDLARDPGGVRGGGGKFFYFFSGGPNRCKCLSVKYLPPTQDKKQLLGLRVDIFLLTIPIEFC
jgi:hypothetical protein